MVAYSFKPSFVAPIIARTKRQTIRIPRKRPTVRGDSLQLFTGPRMRPTKIGDAKCVGALDVRLDFQGDLVSVGHLTAGAFHQEISGLVALDEFAIRDGFTDWRQMWRWWALTHPGKTVFLGTLIDWGDTFTEAQK